MPAAQPARRGPTLARLVLLSALALPLHAAAAGQAAQVQLQLRCSGTVLQTSGDATLQRAVSTLSFSLGLEAEASSAAAALTELQQRLDPVRRALGGLQVRQLRVTAPNVWNRAMPAGQAASFEASIQVSGQLDAAQLQALIAQVGGLPGVRLAPVEAQADRSADAATSSRLVQVAYRAALQQARTLAQAIGLTTLKPLQVQIAGGVRPQPMVALARSAAAGFDPRELPEPTDRLSLEVTFCASR